MEEQLMGEGSLGERTKEKQKGVELVVYLLTGLFQDSLDNKPNANFPLTKKRCQVNSHFS